jgi:GNAT superfamily N-acetyltransferase
MTDVRPAGPEDAAGIATVHLETWQMSYRGVVPAEVLAGLSLEPRLAFWQRFLDDPPPGHGVWVARDGDDVVGFCSAGPAAHPERDGADAGELTTIYVHPDRQGRGTGRALMGPALRHLREGPWVEAVAWVLTEMEPTHRFYQAAGWRDDGAIDDESMGVAGLRTRRYRIAVEPLPEVATRPAAIADAQSIADVNVRAWRVSFRSVLEDEVLDAQEVEPRARYFRENLPDPPGSWTRVATARGRVVGFSHVGPNRDEDLDAAQIAELYGLYVDPFWQGRRVGRRLMAEVIDNLRTAGYRAASLWTLRDQMDTRRFYERAGWRTDGQTKIPRSSSGHPIPQVRYLLELG